jgi:uncharacterized protein
MAQPFLVLHAVDVRRAEVSGSGRATTISKMVIPSIKFKTTSRSAGGGVMDIDYMQTRIQPIEPGLMVHGIDTDLMPGLRDRWTFAGAMRNVKTGASVALRCEIEGAIVEWSPDEADPSQFNGCNHQIKEVTHFELSLDGREIWYADEEERELRRLGVSLTSADRQALGG